jgi:hypothetical protein
MRFPAASFGTIGFAFSPFDALQKIPSGHLDLNGFLAARVAVLACPIPLVLSREIDTACPFPVDPPRLHFWACAVPLWQAAAALSWALGFRTASTLIRRR